MVVRGRAGWVVAAAAVAALALTGCDGGGETEPTGAQEPAETVAEETTVEETTEAGPAYDAATVEALLPELSPGGATYGEDPFAADVLRPVTACYETVADEDDGELLNAFYGEYDVDAVWITAVVAPDAETAGTLAAEAAAGLADCSGTVAATDMIDSEAVDSGTAEIAGAEAGWAVYQVGTPNGIVHDGLVAFSIENVVIQVVTGAADAATAQANVLAYADEVAAALAAG